MACGIGIARAAAVKALAFAVLAGLLAAGSAAAQSPPGKMQADYALMKANSARNDAAGMRTTAELALGSYQTMLGMATKAYIANQASMTQEQKDAYAAHMAAAGAAFNAGAQHDAAGDDRMYYGDGRLAAGDDLYAAQDYWGAAVCYDGPPPAALEGAVQHFQFARNDFATAAACWQEATRQAQLAGLCTNPP